MIAAQLPPIFGADTKIIYGYNFVVLVTIHSKFINFYFTSKVIGSC